jgi:hypothetical protein
VSSPQIQYTIRSLPDLVIDTVVAPLTAYTGQQIEIEWIVRNAGTGGTQGTLWSDAVYLSSDATFNAGLDIYLGSVQNLAALEDGQSYTHDATLILPNNTVGNYYIFVHSDKFYNLTEANDNNNWTRSAAVAMIELSPLPDLDAVSVVTPSLSFSGETISVLYTVENDGTAPTGLKTWHDRIWLTTDPGNPGEFLLATIPHTANLLPDSSYSKNVQLVVPNGIFGQYYVIVRTDFHDVVYEFAAETNNTLASDTIQILLNPPADLVITSFTIADTISSDFINPMSWTVTNMGAGPTLAARWRDEFYISPAPVFNSNFNLLFERKYRAQSVASMNAYTTNDYSFPHLLPAGLYYIYGYTDQDNYEYEYNMESNNIYAYTTPVIIANPDLIVQETVTPDTVNGNTGFMISWKQLNIRAGQYVNKLVRTRIYGSASPDFNPLTAHFITERIVHNQQMAPYDTIPESISLAIPPQLYGDVYLHFHINYNGAVYESVGDTNNIFSTPMPIFVIEPPVPDLEVMAFDIPDTVTAGVLFTVQYSTQNSGTSPIFNPWDDDVFISFDSLWVPGHATKLTDIRQTAMLQANDTIHSSVFIALNPEITENVYYIYVVSDEKNAMYEGSGENNNIKRSASFYVRGAPVVDLAVDTLILEDAMLMSGLSYDIAWTTEILNGHIPVIRTWKDHVYLSSDTALDTLEDIRVGLFTPNTFNTVFEPGVPLDLEDQIDIPAGVTGLYYLIVQSDFTELHHDTIRENNIEFLRDAEGDATQINIGLSPSPDLMISTFDAPASVVVNQQVPIQICITNAGIGGAFPYWQNKLYLSSDLLINAGDVQLSTFNTQTNDFMTFLPDSTICYSLNVVIPAAYSGNFYLLANIDALNRVYEHNGESNNLTVREIEVNQPLPSDLIISEIVIPLEAIAGDVIQVTWGTKNIGTNPAYGVIREIVYLSSDSIWSQDDPVFGLQDTSAYIPPLTTMASSFTGPVTDVVEGLYYALVQTDARQQINETDNDNNTSASIDLMDVGVKTLPIDTLTLDSLYGNQELYYKIEILTGWEGESMVISMAGDSAIGLNELYVKLGSIPTRGDFDHGPQQAAGAYQHIIIPELEVGTYYITGYGSTQTGDPQEVELLATILPFEILSSAPNIGVKDKQVTVEIRGVKLDQTERFRLRNSDPWFELVAEQVYVHNDNLVYATFDLTGVPLDTYQLDGVKGNNALAVAPEEFIVIESGEPELQIQAFAPGIFNSMTSPSKIVINYINTGDVDYVGAIVEVEAPYGNLIAPTLAALLSGVGQPILEVELHEPNGPPNIIRPGASGTLEVFLWSTPGTSFVVGLKQ